MSAGTGADAAPPLGQRPNEPTPGKDSLQNPQGRADGDGDGDGEGRSVCPDCGLPFGEHPEYHAHGDDNATAESDLPGRRLDEPGLGGDSAEA